MKAIFDAQRAYFLKNSPRSLEERIQALTKLEKMVLSNESEIINALHQDFGRRVTSETQLLELVPLVSEIRYCKRHLKKWMKDKKVSVDWNFRPARAKIIYQPLGVIGIIGAWNYPITLVLGPLANALAAGNCAMIKPSKMAPATADLITRLIAKTFLPEEVSVVNEDGAAFSRLPFDHLVFTGSGNVGKKVMTAAAENLTPVTLELGGKSPAIIHESYDVVDAADKIITSKLWNAGQTCIAPDYILVQESKRDALVAAIELSLQTRFKSVVASPDYTHMINSAEWSRMHDLVADAERLGAKVVSYNPKNEQADEASGVFLPTLLLDVRDDMRVMQDEIFGPILPIMTYKTLDAAVTYVNQHDRPLALYYFDDDNKRIDYMLRHTTAGGVVINDCMLHFAQHALPFGGVGGSGMGAYHGHAGFLAFSKQTGVYLQNHLVATVFKRLMKPPYGVWSARIIRFLLGK